MTAGFGELHDDPAFARLMQIVTHVRMITIGFNAHLSQQAGAPTITRIVWARNFMTHDLLSLPLTMPTTIPKPIPGVRLHEFSASDILNGFSSQQALYNLIRLSTLTYTLLVLFPMPRVTGLHDRLSQQLMAALDDCTALDLWATHPKMLFWATVLGGIVSEEGGLREWYAEMTRRTRMIIADLGLVDSPGRDRTQSTGRQRSRSRSHSASEVSGKPEADVTWKAARGMFFRFLWFDGPQCDGLGRAFWDEACENLSARAASDESPASASPF
jgi:hypothetical protein